MSEKTQKPITKVDPASLPLSEMHISYFEELLQSGQPHEIDFLFFKNFQADSALFLDVGGNVGNSALSINFICPTWRVISFEPNPSLKYFLDRVADTYKARGGDFKYFQLGLSSESAEASLYIPQIDNWMVIGEASLDLAHFNDPVVSERLASYSGSGQWSYLETTISIVTFDEFLKSNQIFGDEKWIFVKIDVEGAEVQVLDGMKDFIASKRPIFMIENSVPDLISEKLAQWGYKAFDYHVANRCLRPKYPGSCLNSFYIPDGILSESTQFPD